MYKMIAVYMVMGLLLRVGLLTISVFLFLWLQPFQ